MQLLSIHHSYKSKLASLLLAIAVLAWVAMVPSSAAIAAPAQVQAASALASTGKTVSIKLSKSTVAGNLLFVYVVWDNTGTAAVSDAQGDIFSAASAPVLFNSNHNSAQIFYAKNIVGSTTTVTATFGTSLTSFGIGYGHEYSGLDKTTPLDVTKSAIGTGSAMNSGSSTTTNANDLLIGAGISSNSVTAAGAGFTSRSTAYGNIVEDRTVTATGSYSAVATQNGSYWSMQLVALKAASAVGDTQAPTVPTNLSATATSSSQATLGWTASTDNVGVAGYKIYRDGVQIATSALTTYQDSGLAAGTTYSYTVAAYDAAGNVSAQSAATLVTTQSVADTQAPSIPTSLNVASSQSTQANLSWTASTDNVAVTGYKIYRDGNQVSTTSATSFTDTGLTASTTYSYTVAAYDAAGNVSAQSAATLVTTPAASAFAWPTSVSTNHRYLLDQNSQPYMIVADSPHSLVVNLSPADMETYFASRRASGINGAWVEILDNSYTGGNSNGATYDGIVPFTTSGNLSTPNEAYFQRMDAAVQAAQRHGITLYLTPIDTGGWINTIRASSTAQMNAYGQFLGARYKNYPNVFWQLGNDFQTWSTTSDDNLMHALAQGLRSADPNHMQTIELNYDISGTQDDPSWTPAVDMDAAYTYFPTYDEVLKEYNRGTMPVFMVEANYEGENLNNTSYNTTSETLRRQEYWTMFSGGTGQFFGNHTAWTFPSGWQNNLNTPGVAQFGYMKNLLNGRSWYSLVPDQSHAFLTTGYGTYTNTQVDVLQSDYATAAVTPGGNLGMVYMPTARTVTVDMSKLSGNVTAQWYDPTTGTYTGIAGSPFAPSGMQQFTTPGTHADGASDWVLVLDAGSGGSSDTQAPSAPTSLNTTAVSATQATLGWTASTDNVGVAGYNIYRNGTQVGTTAVASYTDTGLTASTTYSYTVAAYDAAGNVSAISQPLSVTTSATSIATPTFIQKSEQEISAGSSVSTALPSNATAGNLLAVYVVWDNSSAATVTDSRGDIYTAATARTTFGSSNQWSAQIFYAKNIAGGATTVTATFGTVTSSFGLLYAHEYSGIDSTNPLDTAASAHGASGSLVSGQITTTASDLLFAAGASSQAVTGTSTGFTARSTGFGNLTEDIQAPTAGNYTASATQNGSSWVMQLVAFRAAGQ